MVGVGNPWRSDDAAGLEVARRLVDLNQEPGIHVRRHEGDGTGLLALWEDADAVVIVDAARLAARAGTLLRLDAGSTAVPLALGSASSHALGVAEAIELARALQTLPKTVIVFALSGVSYGFGSALSAPVAAAIDAAADTVRHEALTLARGRRAAT